MSKQTSILELSLSGQHAEAAKIWAHEIKQFHDNPPNGLSVFDADSPVTNLITALEQNIVPKHYRNVFNFAAKRHTEITELTIDDHVILHYHPHHFNFTVELVIDGNIIDDNEANQLIAPSYGFYGPVEREAAAFLYNPVSPTDSRFEKMKDDIMDWNQGLYRLENLLDATGWDEKLVCDLHLIRSVENWANRLMEESQGKTKEIPPYGQVNSEYWEEYVSKVASKLAARSELMP